MYGPHAYYCLRGGRTGDCGMIGLCTDSNAQLPRELIERYGVEVVPISVNVDGVDYLEGVDLDVDEFYGRYTAEHHPEVATSPPSPGQFALAYDDLVARGATEILSVHVSSGLSGTLNAARLAARHSPAPVRLVDTGTASFAVGCCVWAAAEAIARGAGLDEAAQVAERLAPHVGNVFVVGALDLVRPRPKSARAPAGPGAAVLSLVDGVVDVIDRVADFGGAVASMTRLILGWGSDLSIALGVADLGGSPLCQAIADAVAGDEMVREVVHYRIGPSVAAHSGPGTVCAFYFPMTWGAEA